MTVFVPAAQKNNEKWNVLQKHWMFLQNNNRKKGPSGQNCEAKPQQKAQIKFKQQNMKWKTQKWHICDF